MDFLEIFGKVITFASNAFWFLEKKYFWGVESKRSQMLGFLKQKSNFWRKNSYFVEILDKRLFSVIMVKKVPSADKNVLLPQRNIMPRVSCPIRYILLCRFLRSRHIPTALYYNFDISWRHQIWYSGRKYSYYFCLKMRLISGTPA